MKLSYLVFSFIILVFFPWRFCTRDHSHQESDGGIIPELIDTRKDSALLIKYLDSLPQVIFPYYSTAWNREDQKGVNISCFGKANFYNLKYTMIPTEIEGGRIDYEDTYETFDLTDTSYIARWMLIKKNPKFFIIEMSTGGCVKFATLSYDLKLIDAINSSTADPLGNANFRAFRKSMIESDLSIVIKHYFEGRSMTGDDYLTSEKEEEWYVDEEGYFRKKE